MEEQLIQLDPDRELQLGFDDELHDCTSLISNEATSWHGGLKEGENLERVPKSTKVPGQVFCIATAEDAKVKSGTISFQETDVYRLAEFIDAHQKHKRLNDFIAQFKSCFETKAGRLALTNLDPDLFGSTPAEAAARFLAKHDGESRFQS